MKERIPLTWFLAVVAAVALAVAGAGCSGDAPDLDGGLKPVTTHLTYFKDSEGRYVQMKGINLGGNIKVPVANGTQAAETPKTYYGHLGDQVAALKAGQPMPFTYVGRPFSLKKAEEYFRQLKMLGFNSVRLLGLWETIYPEKKFKADAEYLAYFEQLIQLAAKYDIYVMINLHENLWSRTFYTLYSEWPVCQQCCNYDANNHAIDPEGKVTDIVCDADRKKECCPQGDLMNMLWSLFPQKSRDELGIQAGDPVEVQAAKYRAGYSDRVSGDGAPLWATKVCVPEKHFDSPWWGVNKFLGAAVENTGALGADLLSTLKIAADVVAAKNIVTQQVADQVKGQLDRMEPYLPPVAFTSQDTYDGLPWKMWGINNGLSLATNICFAAFYRGDEVFPKRRAVEYGYADQLAAKGVDIETFYTPEEAEARAAELRGKGYTYVQVNDLRESLLGGYRAAWQEMARIGKKYPNVIGYDMLNEPAAVYLLMTIVQAYLDLGSPELVASLLDGVLKDDKGAPYTLPSGQTVGKFVQQLLEENLELLPKDNSDETRKALGLFGGDLMKMVNLNVANDKNLLEPLYEYVGAGIVDVYNQGDKPANRLTFWLEPANGLDTVLSGSSGGGVGGQFQQYATTPDLKLPAGFQEKCGEIGFVWSPHWYPDIYPMLGFNMPERTFGTDEYAFRDYSDVIRAKKAWAAYAYNNIPFVLAEFGTYWNFRYLDPQAECDEWVRKCRLMTAGFLSPDCQVSRANCPLGWQQSRANEYLVSAQILDNYYENFEQLNDSSMVWVYSPDADPKYGDWWDHEDFSLVEFIRKDREPDRYAKFQAAPWVPERYVVRVADPEGIVIPRGQAAYVRPHAHLLSGKPVSTHFYSDLHYFDPDKGVPDAVHEFQVVFGSKETDAPSVIFVPELQYPDGFYVWLSDGYAVWSRDDQYLYYYPERDEPGIQHTVTIRPPIQGQDSRDWKYFIHDGNVVTAN